MIENERDGVYLITHSYGEVIDGITYDETSAKFLVDKLNEKYEKSMKCSACRLRDFVWEIENCDNAEVHKNDYDVYCTNDVNQYGVFPYKYHYQKIDVLDVNKMLGEENL